MMTPMISVILPVYNIQEYLPKCMDSLFCQTYTNLELVLVDDGSTDQSGMLCDHYAETDKRIKVIHKTNGGLSDARNAGIERAQGEFITCIDPDDYVDKDYISYLFGLVKKYNTKMSIAQHRVHYDNGTIKDMGSSGDEALKPEKCLERLLYHDVIDTSAWGKLYHKSLFAGVKYPKGKLFEDIGTTYKLIMQCDKIAVGYEAKYNYVFHNNSIVNGVFNSKKLDLMEMTDEMGENVLKKYSNLKEAVLRRRVYSRISTLNQMLNAKGYEKERGSIIEFIKKYRGDILKNPKAPFRDKGALLLLTVSYRAYKSCWLHYQKKIMKKEKM